MATGDKNYDAHGNLRCKAARAKADKEWRERMGLTAYTLTVFKDDRARFQALIRNSQTPVQYEVFKQLLDTAEAAAKAKKGEK